MEQGVPASGANSGAGVSSVSPPAAACLLPSCPWHLPLLCFPAPAAPQALLARLDGLERQQLPALQAKWEDVATKCGACCGCSLAGQGWERGGRCMLQPPPPTRAAQDGSPDLPPAARPACPSPAAPRRAPERLAEVLGGLQQAVAQLAQQRETLAAGRERRGAAAGRLSWLLLAAAGYGQHLLSRADVAALLLSRRILLGPSGEAAGAGGEAPPPARHLSAGLGALLFVACVEAAYQAQRRALARLPAFAQRATAPAQLGLRVARAAVWSAALVLAAAQTRAACRAASDSVCAAAAAAASQARLPAWVQALPLVQRWVERRGKQPLGAAPGAGDDAGPAGTPKAAAQGEACWRHASPV